jgi:hypothetical protein
MGFFLTKMDILREETKEICSNILTNFANLEDDDIFYLNKHLTRYYPKRSIIRLLKEYYPSSNDRFCDDNEIYVPMSGNAYWSEEEENTLIITIKGVHEQIFKFKYQKGLYYTKQTTGGYFPREHYSDIELCIRISYVKDGPMLSR